MTGALLLLPRHDVTSTCTDVDPTWFGVVTWPRPRRHVGQTSSSRGSLGLVTTSSRGFSGHMTTGKTIVTRVVDHRDDVDTSTSRVRDLASNVERDEVSSPKRRGGRLAQARGTRTRNTEARAGGRAKHRRRFDRADSARHVFWLVLCFSMSATSIQGDGGE
jgi:hypothetical protein